MKENKRPFTSICEQFNSSLEFNNGQIKAHKKGENLRRKGKLCVKVWGVWGWGIVVLSSTLHLSVCSEVWLYKWCETDRQTDHTDLESDQSTISF